MQFSMVQNCYATLKASNCCATIAKRQHQNEVCFDISSNFKVYLENQPSLI